jgi:hypothetical protein
MPCVVAGSTNAKNPKSLPLLVQRIITHEDSRPARVFDRDWRMVVAAAAAEEGPRTATAERAIAEARGINLNEACQALINFSTSN